jgi:hypothetical protein
MLDALAGVYLRSSRQTCFPIPEPSHIGRAPGVNNVTLVATDKFLWQPLALVFLPLEDWSKWRKFHFFELRV